MQFVLFYLLYFIDLVVIEFKFQNEGIFNFCVNTS